MLGFQQFDLVCLMCFPLFWFLVCLCVTDAHPPLWLILEWKVLISYLTVVVLLVSSNIFIK
jgi:hypothetical protein